MLTCVRAVAVLRGLEQNALVCEVDEIDELLAHGLAIEADPDDLGVLTWLAPVVREFTRREVGDPLAVAGLEEWLGKINKDLSSDWYRMTTSATERARREQDKVVIQRALGLLRDGALVQALQKISGDAREMAPGTPWVVCEALGVERYATTMKGRRVLRSLGVRLERFAQASLKSFLHAFEKTATKMRAFSTEISTFASNVGYVKKNREQIIIGLAKAGMPAGHALGAYHAALGQTKAPDVAVTCTRHAAAFGSPAHAAQRLRMAEDALRDAGYPSTPIVMGAAKSLLAFHPPAAGLPRFNDFMARLQQAFGRSEVLFKFTARLMAAAGHPHEVMARVDAAARLLSQMPSQVARASDPRAAAVALGAMAKSLAAMPDLVRRFREIERLLGQSGLSTEPTLEADTLECVGCPGTPAEVIDTMTVLVEHLAHGRQPVRGDIAVAAAFAKRFSF